MGKETKGAFGGKQIKKVQDGKHDFFKDESRLIIVCKKCLKEWTKEEIWRQRLSGDWVIKLPTCKCPGSKKPK